MKHKYTFLFALPLCMGLACTPSPQEEGKDNLIGYVNPMIGTDFTGNTYPGAQVPFGMVQLSPDNGLPGWDRISGYFYPDSTIAGFSHTHLSGTGAGDLYDISFMPVTNPYKTGAEPLGIYSSFSHNDESASAGYYRVLLKDYNINVELTATERCGIQRERVNIRDKIGRDECKRGVGRLSPVRSEPQNDRRRAERPRNFRPQGELCSPCKRAESGSVPLPDQPPQDRLRAPFDLFL